MQTMSLVLIGDDALRAAIKARLGRHSELQLVGEIGESAGLWLLPELAPEVVVLDCAAPALNSLIILPWLRELPGAPHVIAVGASGSTAEEQFVLALGADQYTTVAGLAPLLLGLRQIGPLACLPSYRAA